jgi:hypothetical protein
MDAPQWNGAPGPEHDPGRSNGQPVVYRCLRCGWRGKGSIARAEHWRRFRGHGIIVPKEDPRFTQPATESEVA